MPEQPRFGASVRCDVHFLMENYVAVWCAWKEGIGLEKVRYRDLRGSRIKGGFFFCARSPPEQKILAGCKKMG